MLLLVVLALPVPNPVAPLMPAGPCVPVAPVSPVAPNPLTTLTIPVSSIFNPLPIITPPTVLDVATGNT